MGVQYCQCEGELRAIVLPLHGKLQPDEQKAATKDRAPAGARKIVFTTNVR